MLFLAITFVVICYSDHRKLTSASQMVFQEMSLWDIHEKNSPKSNKNQIIIITNYIK